MIKISKILNTINKLFYNELSDFEKIVLKMCNGEAPICGIDKYRVSFEYKGFVYEMWFANEVYGMHLDGIDGERLSLAMKRAIKIRHNLRIKLWNKYNIAYKKVRDGLDYDKIKEFEKKHSIKII